MEKDISRDQAAAMEIVQKGKAAGIPEQYLTSVPLLNVNGKVIVGFDADQVRSALGRQRPSWRGF